MLTQETKSTIDDNIEKLLNDLETTIILGVSEEMSPNDPEYYATLNTRWETGMTYVMKKLENY